MSKFLLFLSFLSLVFVLLGSLVAPQALMFWFTSTGHAYQYLRIALAAVLLMQLVTRPPRNVWFRVVAGSLGVLTGLWVGQQTYLYHMMLLDAFSLSAASLAITVTALEGRPELVASLRHTLFTMFIAARQA